ncbi:MAG: hypothetical protein RR279_06415, partial [Alistipes sp.]
MRNKVSLGMNYHLFFKYVQNSSLISSVLASHFRFSASRRAEWKEEEKTECRVLDTDPMKKTLENQQK